MLVWGATFPLPQRSSTSLSRTAVPLTKLRASTLHWAQSTAALYGYFSDQHNVTERGEKHTPFSLIPGRERARSKAVESEGERGRERAISLQWTSLLTEPSLHWCISLHLPWTLIINFLQKIISIIGKCVERTLKPSLCDSTCMKIEPGAT